MKVKDSSKNSATIANGHAWAIYACINHFDVYEFMYFTDISSNFVSQDLFPTIPDYLNATQIEANLNDPTKLDY